MLNYENLLKDIETKEYISFYNFLYFPKEHELWYDEEVFYVWFTKNTIVIKYNECSEEKVKTKIINNFKNIFKYCDTEKFLDSCTTVISNTKDIFNTNYRSPLKGIAQPDLFFDIIQFINFNYTIINQTINLTLNNTISFTTNDDNIISFTRMRDIESYYYKIESKDIINVSNDFSKKFNGHLKYDKYGNLIYIIRFSSLIDIC